MSRKSILTPEMYAEIPAYSSDENSAAKSTVPMKHSIVGEVDIFAEHLRCCRRIICKLGSVALSWVMPWRRKPNSRLRYWTTGRPADMKAEGFPTILVYCVGPPDRDPRLRCWHYSVVPLDRLPLWGWYDILAHFKCTQCGSVGWVDPRPNWSEVINYSKGVS